MGHGALNVGAGIEGDTPTCVDDVAVDDADNVQRAVANGSCSVEDAADRGCGAWFHREIAILDAGDIDPLVPMRDEIAILDCQGMRFDFGIEHTVHLQTCGADI